ncbi:hypothetical protein GQS40_13105|uniref:Uncharacterized protein n=1 Tax=Leuconostoc lactis TaxID=1246 RepID=A0A6L7AHJ0_LEULA|nr:hypothetical protein [Leuconostoc lactis]
MLDLTIRLLASLVLFGIGYLLAKKISGETTEEAVRLRHLRWPIVIFVFAATELTTLMSHVGAIDVNIQPVNMTGLMTTSLNFALGYFFFASIAAIIYTVIGPNWMKVVGLLFTVAVMGQPLSTIETYWQKNIESGILLTGGWLIVGFLSLLLDQSRRLDVWLYTQRVSRGELFLSRVLLLVVLPIVVGFLVTIGMLFVRCFSSELCRRSLCLAARIGGGRMKQALQLYAHIKKDQMLLAFILGLGLMGLQVGSFLWQHQLSAIARK